MLAEQISQRINAYLKELLSMTLAEAIMACVDVIQGSTGVAYACSEGVFRVTRAYHHNDDGKFMEVCVHLVKAGIDVVDDEVEIAYKCWKNIEGYGEDQIHCAEGERQRSSSENGRLYRLGVSNGWLFSR